MEVEPGEVGSGSAEMADGAVLRRKVIDQDVNVFHCGKVPDDLAIEPGDGLELHRPVLGVVRPGDPGGSVRSPFGWHAVVRLDGRLQHIPSSVMSSLDRILAGGAGGWA